MIRYQLSMALVPIPNIFTYNINLITGNQPIMATIFRLLFIDHKFNNNMSNAVKSLSAPLAQCVKHRSSNQTLTGSNLAAYPLFIFFLFYIVNKTFSDIKVCLQIECMIFSNSE